MLRRILRRPQPLAFPPDKALTIAENVASLRAIPDSELPDADARAALIALAEAGHDVYAYTPVGYDRHTIWIRPEWPDQEGRWTCAQWIAAYRAGVALDAQGGEHAD